MLLAPGVEVGGTHVGRSKQLADRAQLLKDRTQQLLCGRGGGVQHLHRDLLDPQHIPSEAGDFVGVEHQRFLLIAAVLRVELARIEGGVEIAWIGVGVAVDRRA